MPLTTNLKHEHFATLPPSTEEVLISEALDIGRHSPNFNEHFAAGTIDVGLEDELQEISKFMPFLGMERNALQLLFIYSSFLREQHLKDYHDNKTKIFLKPCMLQNYLMTSHESRCKILCFLSCQALISKPDELLYPLPSHKVAIYLVLKIWHYFGSLVIYFQKWLS